MNALSHSRDRRPQPNLTMPATRSAVCHASRRVRRLRAKRTNPWPAALTSIAAISRFGVVMLLGVTLVAAPGEGAGHVLATHGSPGQHALTRQGRDGFTDRVSRLGKKLAACRSLRPHQPPLPGSPAETTGFGA
jgi:hypothetical protein